MHYIDLTMYGALLVFVFVAAAVGQKYTTKFDNIDVHNILHNDRLFNSYFDCLMDKGTCSPEAQELKKNIPDALETECSKCSEKQKKHLDEIFKFLYEKKADKFKQLEAKYDPNGKYRKKYSKRAEKAGIKL